MCITDLSNHADLRLTNIAQSGYFTKTAHSHFQNQRVTRIRCIDNCDRNANVIVQRFFGGVRIRVQDDGPGIPRKFRQRIFDAGFTTKDRGWGIGLSLARRIVHENHAGKLVLADTDRGAAFDVILHG